MKTLKREHGSVLVFITLMMLVLFVMVGLGLDAGQITYGRATGQGAVDAAAMAAVTGLPTSVASVNNRATAVVTGTRNTFLGSGSRPRLRRMSRWSLITTPPERSRRPPTSPPPTASVLPWKKPIPTLRLPLTRKCSPRDFSPR